MSGVIVEEVRLLLISAAIGILLLLIYEGIRIVRNLIAPRQLFLALEDFLLAGRIPFDILDGIQIQRRAMRGFIIGGAALGMIVRPAHLQFAAGESFIRSAGFSDPPDKKGGEKIGRKRRQKGLKKEQEIQ